MPWRSTASFLSSLWRRPQPPPANLASPALLLLLALLSFPSPQSQPSLTIPTLSRLFELPSARLRDCRSPPGRRCPRGAPVNRPQPPLHSAHWHHPSLSPPPHSLVSEALFAFISLSNPRAQLRRSPPRPPWPTTAAATPRATCSWRTTPIPTTKQSTSPTRLRAIIPIAPTTAALSITSLSSSPIITTSRVCPNPPSAPMRNPPLPDAIRPTRPCKACHRPRPTRLTEARLPPAIRLPLPDRLCTRHTLSRPFPQPVS